MARHRAAWWETIVAEVEQGGALLEVAARHGVNARTLGWWRGELGRRSRQAGESRRAARLLPVKVRRVADDGAIAKPPPSEIVLERGELRIRVRGVVLGKHLEAIVRGFSAGS